MKKRKITYKEANRLSLLLLLLGCTLTADALFGFFGGRFSDSQISTRLRWASSILMVLILLVGIVSLETKKYICLLLLLAVICALNVGVHYLIYMLNPLIAVAGLILSWIFLGIGISGKYIIMEKIAGVL